MRLLYVVHQFFPYAQSGTEQYCLAVAREARRRGDEVTILSLHWGHDRQTPPIDMFDEPFDGFRVLRLNHWRGINPNDVLRDYDNRHLDGWFQQALRDVSPDAVHFFHLRQLSSTWIGLAKTAGARTVVNLMDFWFLCPRFTLRKSDGSLCLGPEDDAGNCVRCNHPKLQDVTPAPSPAGLLGDQAHRLRALLDRKPAQLQRLSGADAVVAPSRFLAGVFEQNGLRHDATHVVPYGLERGSLETREVTRPRSPLRLGFCGVMSPWKAPMLAVDAVRMVEGPLELHLHGDVDEPMFADYIARMRQRACDDARVTFHGAYTRDRAADVYAQLDALIVPSTWYENTPFVVLEAFAAGIPVIASDLGGLSEVVEHERNGLLFQAGDAQALAAAIRRLVAEPGLYASLCPEPPRSIADDYVQFRALYSG
jgi:glycosyltransferase involved in cell wall biosynthesis